MIRRSSLLVVSSALTLMCAHGEVSAQTPTGDRAATPTPPSAGGADEPPDKSAVSPPGEPPDHGADKPPESHPEVGPNGEPCGAHTEPPCPAAPDTTEPSQEPAVPSVRRASVSPAVPPAVQSPVQSGAEPAETSEPEPKSAKIVRERKTIKWAGRIFLRNTSSRFAAGAPDDNGGWANDLHLDSARMSVKYRDRKLGLRMDVEAELAGGEAKIRDGFIRWQPRRHFRLQVGRFREPVSSVTQESRWSLPIIERGLLNDFEWINEYSGEPDVLSIGQRNIGVLAQVRTKVPTKPKFSLAVFRSRVHKQIAQAQVSLPDRSRVPLRLSSLPEDLYARVEFEPLKNLNIGSTFGWLGRLREAGTRGTFEHSLMGSLDLAFKYRWARVWLEAFTGQSPFHIDNDLIAKGLYFAYRGVAAAKFKLEEGPLAYLEPFASVQFLDLSTELEDDTAMEYALGLVVGIDKSFRVQIGFDQRTVDSRLAGGISRFIIQAAAIF